MVTVTSVQATTGIPYDIPLCICYVAFLIDSRVAGLDIVLDELANSGAKLSTRQTDDLSTLLQGCQDVLHDLEQVVAKYSDCSTRTSGLKNSTVRAWKRLMWDQKEIDGLRSRIVSNTSLMDLFTSNVARSVPLIIL